MKHAYAIITAAILLPTVAVAQQAQAPSCPDYSQQLAIGLQASQDAQVARNYVAQLDKMVTDLRKQLKDAETKVTADDVLIKSLRDQLAKAGVKEPKPEDGKPSEPSAPSPEAK